MHSRRQCIDTAMPVHEGDLLSVYDCLHLFEVEPAQFADRQLYYTTYGDLSYAIDDLLRESRDAQSGLQVAVLVVPPIFLLVVVNNGFLYFLDSHSHLPHGAMIAVPLGSDVEVFNMSTHLVWYLQQDIPSSPDNEVSLVFLYWDSSHGTETDYRCFALAHTRC